jgi:LEA14-like dessication related protein
MKFNYKIASLLFILLILVACSTLKDPKLVSVDKIQLDMDSTTEIQNNISIISSMKIYNPNWFTIKSNEVDFKVYIDTFFVGKANIIGELNLKKRDTGNVKVCLKLQKDFLESKINFKDTLQFSLLGSADIPYFPKKYYFNLEYKIKSSDFVNSITDGLINEGNIKIKEVKIDNLSVSNIQFNVLFNVNNTINMDYVINKLEVDIYNSKSFNKVIGNSSLNEPMNIKANSVNEFSTTVNVNTLKLGASLINSVMNKQNSLFMNVNAIVSYKNILFPFTIRKEVEYNPLTLQIRLK